VRIQIVKTEGQMLKPRRSSGKSNLSSDSADVAEYQANSAGRSESHETIAYESANRRSQNQVGLGHI
jgi:hypothetical protein